MTIKCEWCATNYDSEICPICYPKPQEQITIKCNSPNGLNFVLDKFGADKK